MRIDQLLAEVDERAWNMPAQAELINAAEVCVASHPIYGRRAVSLEGALSEHQLDQPVSDRYHCGIHVIGLKRLYRCIVRCLLQQFFYEPLPKDDNWEPSIRSLSPLGKLELGSFVTAPVSTRFAINVFAEAIIATWIGWDLPEAAARPIDTYALAHNLGWTELGGIRLFEPPANEWFPTFRSYPANSPHWRLLQQFARTFPHALYRRGVWISRQEQVVYAAAQASKWK